MPLLDHFHPAPDNPHSWRTIHGIWAGTITRLLNRGVLPPGYVASAFVDRPGPVEIDVAALRSPNSTGGPFTPQPWAESPAATVAVTWPPANSIGVEVRTNDGEFRLAAVIELVSPRNKDRPAARQAFVAKCAEHLNAGSGVVVVDVVTNRRANLHAEMLELLGVEPTDAGGSLSVVAYRSLGGETDGRLDIWPAALEIGHPLPTVPLWLHGEFAVPLDLEASHNAACDDLRIRRAG